VLTLLKRHKELLLVGALLLYPFFSYLASGHRGRSPHAIDRAVMAVASYLQLGLTFALDGVGDGISSYVFLRGVNERNLKVESENSQLRAEVNSLKEAAAENLRLSRQLGYGERTVEVEIGARIIGVDPSSTFLAVRIDRGEDDGVRAGMPVVTPDGVVGRVQRASGGWADVSLITNMTSKIGVLVQRSRARGNAAGAGAGPLVLEYVLRTDDVEDGDLIITSGTDGVFPKGLVVGRVTGVQRPASGPFLSAGILPAVDLLRLEEVLVVPVTPISGQAPLLPAASKEKRP
jgi:rod shape-determining protein MreC